MKFISLIPETAYQSALETIGESPRIVVCGSEEDKQYIEESMHVSDSSVAEILEAAENIDVSAWFAARKQQLETDAEMVLADAQGEWPGESDAKQGFALTFDMMSGEPLKEVVGARVDTDSSWKIPAYFRFGDWNECPQPELHCAIWYYWQQKYGAEIVGFSNDVIEAYIANPPTTETEALELAMEQYLYCADIVDQGVESIANLAASIVNHNAWFFWWD